MNGAISVDGNTYDAREAGAECYTAAGYDDIKEGAQVEVRDGSGTTLSLGSLRAGEMDADAILCVFSFTVSDVPEGEDIYGIAVGSNGRGVPKYTREQLIGVLELSLG